MAHHLSLSLTLSRHSYGPRLTNIRCLLSNRKEVSVITVFWRSYSAKPPSGGFFRNFLENLRKDMEKSKEIENNLKAFEEERNRIIKTDAVKLLKQKIHGAQEWLITVTLKIVDYAKSSMQYSKGQITSIRQSSSQVFKRLSETDVGRKGHQMTSTVSKKAQESAEKLSEHAQTFGKTDMYKTMAKGAETVKEDLLDDIIKESNPYQAPEKIVKRSERGGGDPAYDIKPDDESRSIYVTKGSGWRLKWNEWKENNPISDLIFNFRMKYDESDNIVIRASRTVTDKFSGAFEGMSQKSTLLEAVTEIRKIDPYFNVDNFTNECKYEIIPNILEAYFGKREDILSDWCGEAAYKHMQALFETEKKQDRVTKVLEVYDIQVINGKVLDPGPVLVLSFMTQELEVEVGKDSSSRTEELKATQYLWALCRDQSIYNPKAAWRLIEFGIHERKPLLV